MNRTAFQTLVLMLSAACSGEPATTPPPAAGPCATGMQWCDGQCVDGDRAAECVDSFPDASSPDQVDASTSDPGDGGPDAGSPGGDAGVDPNPADAGTGCAPGTHLCGTSCFADDDIGHCGTSCAVCPVPPAHGVATCGAAGCGIQCSSGYVACPDRPGECCRPIDVCRLYDQNAAACQAAGCVHFTCTARQNTPYCIPPSFSKSLVCPSICTGLSDNLTACTAEAHCTYFACAGGACEPKGTPQALACPSATSACRADDGYVGRCDANAANCAYYYCTAQCLPYGAYSTEQVCPTQCRAFDGNQAQCNARASLGCTWFGCAGQCWRTGVPRAVVCPERCALNDGNLTACQDAGCKYFECAQECWPLGTPRGAVCPELP